MKKSQKFYLVIKRLIDLIGSFIGIFVMLALIWWWVLILNLISTKGHPIFVSERTGKDGKTIGIVKFRSMKLEIDPNLTSEEIKKIEIPYTWFGKFLRISNIDETLQLVNIFLGQMAFIGPRPLIDIDNDHTTIEIRRKNGAIHLRPGISGYAQIHGRTKVSAEEKANLDGYYYEHFSLWLDIKIFIITILQSIGIGRRNS